MTLPAGVRHLLFLSTIILSFGLTGCQSSSSLYPQHTQDVDMIEISHRAAGNLITQSKGRLDRGPLIVASFANIDNLEQSSTFGRIVAQQIASVFSRDGYQIIEMLLRDTVYIGTNEGEFLLSRELARISTKHDAQAVIVGTYAVGSKNVYVTSKLVRSVDSVVLASEDFVLPLGPDLRTLVKP